ncbi:hypothetical protein LP316_01360 [Thalassotalea sp. LPB0316]|uniref:hypothetical protein n=1 Tax=Thalassotalea sp. LPB0316 TaxID=2769490 RepID=UPI001868A2C0|nr:hypothetical protein [Thalassotalea sp. LPB0316]QOL25990.1 hypothetical protein LP316_01360 [Thalassotalea sp. LPB0316]
MNKSSKLSRATLEQSVEVLEQEIAPTRDLWPGIEKAISQQPQQVEQHSRHSWRVNLALAASVCALVITLVNVKGLPEQTTNPNLVATINQAFESERQAMLVSYGAAQTQRQIPADLQMQLDELVKARASIINALEKDPTNADLIHLLKFTQQQELALLEHIYRPQWQTI